MNDQPPLGYERLTTGHQLRGEASGSTPPEGALASLPSRIWVLISHVSCMPLLAGAWPQENRLTDDKYATNSRRAGGQAENAAAAPTETRSPASSGATEMSSGPRRFMTRAHLTLYNECLPRRPLGWAASKGHAPQCAATFGLISMVSSTSQLAAA